MFTGIVEELGEVTGLDRLGDSARLTVRGPLVTAAAAPGNSIAVNGVCVTVTALEQGEFIADVMGETLARTSLGALAPGSAVNLERPVAAGGRLDGHIVQGHVDGTGVVIEIRPADRWHVVRISTMPALVRYIAKKGSVAVDGVSLTVSELSDGRELVRGQPDPGDAGADHAGPQAGGRRGEHRGRRDRQVRGAAAGHRCPMTGPGQWVVDGIRLDDVERAIADIAAGRAVVVVDDADRENEGDIIFAASKATPELLAFTIRYTSGVICVPMLGEELDRLQLPLMTTQNNERMRTAFTVSVDARDGVTTGISAADRARTVRRLVDSATEPYELVRPGHVFPLRYMPGGVLRRPGHTEAAVDLARLAGLTPAGVLAEVVNDDGTMTRLPGLREFADEHGLALISIAQLIDYRRRAERMVTRVVQTVVPNEYGQWRAIGYLNKLDGTEHLALVLGDIDAPDDAVDQAGRARANAFGVPHRGCSRLAAMRLRNPAERRDGRDRRRGRRHRAVPARARGPGDRPAQQAARVPAAGRRRRHRRRQHRARIPGRRA